MTHDIGKTIAELRKEKGWTQIELAEKLQVSDKAISKWEKGGGTPSIEFFPILAELFGVSIDYLITGKNEENNIFGDIDSTKESKKENIIVCLNCGANLLGNAKFCPKCGKEIKNDKEVESEINSDTQLNAENKPKTSMKKKAKVRQKILSILSVGFSLLSILSLLICSFFIKTGFSFLDLEVIDYETKSIFSYITEPFYTLANKFPYETIFYFLTAGAIIANFMILAIMFIVVLVKFILSFKNHSICAYKQNITSIVSYIFTITLIGILIPYHKIQALDIDINLGLNAITFIGIIIALSLTAFAIIFNLVKKGKKENLFYTIIKSSLSIICIAGLSIFLLLQVSNAICCKMIEAEEGMYGFINFTPFGLLQILIEKSPSCEKLVKGGLLGNYLSNMHMFTLFSCISTLITFAILIKFAFNIKKKGVGVMLSSCISLIITILWMIFSAECIDMFMSLYEEAKMFVSMSLVSSVIGVVFLSLTFLLSLTNVIVSKQLKSQK